MEKKRVEEALRASETRYRRLFETAQDGILILDADTGQIVDVNPFLINLLGFSREQFLGKKIWEIGLFKDIVANKDNFIELQRQEYIRYEDLPLETADGRRIDVEFVSNVYVVNHTRVIQCSIRNITERNQAEEALRESQKRFQALTETTSDFVWEMDANGVYTYCSPQINELWGYKPEDMIGRTSFDIMIPEDRELAIKMFRTLSESPRSFKGMETSSWDTTGKIVVLETSGVPFFDIDGKLCGYRGISRDVTERKRVEEALQHSELQYRSLTENSPDLIARFDRQYRHLYVNPIAAKAGRYSPEEYIGKTIAEVGVPEQEARRWEERIRTVFETGKVIDVEDTFGTPNGQRYFHTKFVPEFATGGSIYSVQSIARDITEHKRAEEELRESENWYRTVFENTGTATVVLEENNIISLANAEFAKLSGYSKNDIEGKKCWTEFVVKEDMERMLAQHRLRRQNHEKAPTHYEFRFVTKSGDIRNIYLTIDVIPGTKKSVASMLDITERKQAEEALRESEVEYRRIVETANEGIWSMSETYTTLYVNQKMADMLGYAVEEMIGKKVSYYFYPEDLPDHDRQMERRVQGEGAVYERRFRHKDGSDRWMIISTTVRKGKQGEFKGSFAMLTDITNRKRAEEEVTHLAQQWQRTFDATNDAIWILDKDQRVLRSNKTAERLCHRPCS